MLFWHWSKMSFFDLFYRIQSWIFLENKLIMLHSKRTCFSFLTMLKEKNGNILSKWKMRVSNFWYVVKKVKIHQKIDNKLKRVMGGLTHFCLEHNTQLHPMGLYWLLNFNFWSQAYLLDRYFWYRKQKGIMPKKLVTSYWAS